MSDRPSDSDKLVQFGPKRMAARRCPICDQPALEKYRPFCSARCADVDLGRWFKGSYAVPTEEGPEDNPPQENRPDEDHAAD